MKIATVLAVLACGLLAPQAALADVKAGVDAWADGDFERAVNEWRPLALAGDADAQFNMGQAYKLGRGVATDLPAALDWYRRAHDQGHIRATDNYGLLLFQQGRRDEAILLIRASAERGEPRAQYIYGTALFNGDLVPQDWVRAYAMMTVAARARLSQATDSLKQMDEYVPEDQRQRALALAATMSGEPATPAAPTQPAPPPTGLGSATPTTLASALAPNLAPTAPPPAGSLPPRPVALAPTPTPAPSPTPPSPAIAAQQTKASPGGRWRVQLGAFAQQGRAEALWKTLSSRVAGLSGLQPFLIESGGVTRLQAGPLASSSEATTLCAHIKAAGSECMARMP